MFFYKLKKIFKDYLLKSLNKKNNYIIETYYYTLGDDDIY